MRYLLLIASLLVYIQGMSQPTYKRIRDEETKQLIYVGQLSFYDLEKEPEFKWFSKMAYSYEPKEETIAYLKEHLNAYDIVTFLGTWCEDSHELMPKLFRVLINANYSLTRKHTLFAVDLNKKGQFGEAEEHNISYVPTVILYNKDGEEIGRIEESIVKETIEEDLKAIIEDYEY